MEYSLYLIPLFPLVGFLINGLLLGRLNKKLISIIGCGSVGLSFLWGLKSFVNLLAIPDTGRQIEEVLFTWIPSGEFSVNIGFLFDPLSAVMVLVVSGVGFLIHVYS